MALPQPLHPPALPPGEPHQIRHPRVPGERPQVVESGGRVHLHELLREGVRSGEDRHGKVPDEREGAVLPVEERPG